MEYLLKISENDIKINKQIKNESIQKTIELSNFITEHKRNSRVKRQRSNTSICTSSGLTFAEKMELLAIEKLIN